MQTKIETLYPEIANRTGMTLEQVEEVMSTYFNVWEDVIKYDPQYRFDLLSLGAVEFTFDRMRQYIMKRKIVYTPEACVRARLVHVRLRRKFEMMERIYRKKKLPLSKRMANIEFNKAKYYKQVDENWCGCEFKQTRYREIKRMENQYEVDRNRAAKRYRGKFLKMFKGMT